MAKQRCTPTGRYDCAQHSTTHQPPHRHGESDGEFVAQDAAQRCSVPLRAAVALRHGAKQAEAGRRVPERSLTAEPGTAPLLLPPQGLLRTTARTHTHSTLYQWHQTACSGLQHFRSAPHKTMTAGAKRRTAYLIARNPLHHKNGLFRGCKYSEPCTHPAGRRRARRSRFLARGRGAKVTESEKRTKPPDFQRKK